MTLKKFEIQEFYYKEGDKVYRAWRFIEDKTYKIEETPYKEIPVKRYDQRRNTKKG